MRLDEEDGVATLDFAQQRELACADGWLQGRYYGEAGDDVAETLSYDRVFDVCPYEVGVDRRADRRRYAARFKKIVRLMELDDLLDRPFHALSNGEMRRVLFARVILKQPRKVILDDPMAGLDPRQRERFRRIISALAKDGVEVVVKCRHADEWPGTKGGARAARPAAAEKRRVPKRESRATTAARPVVELRDVTIKFGKRVLFDHFSWTVRRGERWLLRGPNGSGKTTLMALVTGDSPLAYANDVRVFGVPREPGHELAKIRRRIAMVSPEMQTYLDKGPEELLDEALAREPALLILDEPCLNLDAKDARKLLRRVSAWLAERPSATAIAIVHRDDHAPAGFDHLLSLG